MRWKTLAEQPISWNPGINDGLRLDVRLLVIAKVMHYNKPLKLNIRRDCDRGVNKAEKISAQDKV